MKKIFFCDIDGTLLDGSRGMRDISAKTHYALKELMKDNYVFIASGRCRSLMDKKVMELEPDGYILCNGAYALFHDETIVSKHFDEDTVKKVQEVSLKYDGFAIMEELDNVYVNSYSSKAFQLFIKTWGVSMDGFKENDTSEGDFHISMIGFTSTEHFKEIENELKDYADLFRHTLFDSYDVNIKGVNKGAGVKDVLDYLGIDKENAWCFGDGLNDLEMLESVGHPVIMANSHADLKGRGFAETDDVLDEGFYNYLVSHELIKAM